jgi:hypothetical protein
MQYVQPPHYHANLTWPVHAAPLQLQPLQAPAPQVQTAVLALPAGYQQVTLQAPQAPGNGR